MNKDLKKKIEKDGFELVDLVNLGERECTRLYGKVALRQINQALEEERLPRIGEATLVYWPASQRCADCVHGKHELMWEIEASTYRCSKLYLLTTKDRWCPGYEQRRNDG